MKIGRSDSIDSIQPAHWQAMAQEARLGWPRVRERLASLCRAVQAALRAPALRQAAGEDATAERVGEIIEARSAALLKALA